MQGGAWSIWWAVSWLLLALGAGVAARSLLRERPRGRKRCPRCWYDMAGLAGRLPAVCPECGKRIVAEAQLNRRRTPWRGIGAALGLALLAYGAAVTPRTLSHGAAGAVPGVLLAMISPWAHPGVGVSVDLDSDWANREIDSRIGEGDFGALANCVWMWRTSRAFSGVRGDEPGGVVFEDYDLSAALRGEKPGADAGRRAEVIEAAAITIVMLVSPEGWIENGGDSAAMTRNGACLAVAAPRATHAKIAAVLGALSVPGGARLADHRIIDRFGHREERVIAVVDVSEVVARDSAPAGSDPLWWGSNPAQDRVEFVAALVRAVDESGWMENGGETSVWQQVGRRMVISTTPEVMEQIDAVLEGIRAGGR